jgi:lysophospholipase L1-like esterase
MNPGVFTMALDAHAPMVKPNRREFGRAGIGLTIAGAAALGAVDELIAAETPAAKVEPLIKPGDRILFQGDSITDAGRKRGIDEANSQPALGNGYAWMASAQLLVDPPIADLKIYNRGISGNQVFQLAERWQKDALDLKPDVLSILIGVNDFARTIDRNSPRTVEDYETDYRALIKRTKEALPNVKLVICEPFVLKTGDVGDKWFPGYDGYRAAARKIADESGARFLPFQSLFDVAVKVASPATWAGDGVHPSASGAAMMAHWCLKAVGV